VIFRAIQDVQSWHINEVVWLFWTGPSLTSEAGHRPLKGLLQMSKRRTHSPEFKARVAMEAFSGRKTIQEIAADHAI
jgi:hypothetical protein